MTTEGNGFTYFVDGQGVNKANLSNFDLSGMTISVEGLVVSYFSAKKERDLLKECDEHQSIYGRVNNENIIYGIDTENNYFTTPWTFDEKIKEFKFTDDMANGDAKAVGKEWVQEDVDKNIVFSNYHQVQKYYDLHGNVVKDFGEKETNGKVDYSEINLNILDLIAERFQANKVKYPKGNMLKPIDKDNLVWAAFRHIKKMLQPLDNDPETFREHLASVLCNMSMVLNQLEIAEKK